MPHSGEKHPKFQPEEEVDSITVSEEIETARPMPHAVESAMPPPVDAGPPKGQG